MTTAMTVYKLMVLYMLHHTEYPLTNARISEFILQKGYATYFNLQTALSELLETGLIESESTVNSSFFKPTKDGINTLKLLNEELSPFIKDEIKNYLSDNHVTFREDLSATSNYKLEENGLFSVRLKVHERGNLLLDLSLSVPSKKIAEKICNEWSDKSDDVFAMIFNSLVLNKPLK